MEKREVVVCMKCFQFKKYSVNPKNLIIGLIALLLVSCATHEYMQQYMQPKKKQSIKVIKPDIGVETTVSLGQSIITSGYGHTAKVLKVNSTYSEKHIGLSFFITEGIYELIHSDGKFDYYNPIDNKQIYPKNSHGTIIEPSIYQIRISPSNVISIIERSGYKVPGDFTNNLDYSIIDSMFIEQQDSFQQTMIYLGKEKNILKFSYREFSRNHIRDAFTAEVTYDLSESNIIGYKDFKAEILDATNTSLRYRIISSF